jgi:N-acetylglucosaminyl-diphospho-decaprenol L-rhamnosyltransferase
MLQLSIILVNYNGSKFLEDCLGSIKKYLKEISYEVIIVDNSSSDNSINIIANEFPDFNLICSKNNLGFSRANNLAIKQAKGQYLLFLNTDTILIDDSLYSLLDYLTENHDVGAIGSRLVFENLRYQLSFGNPPNLVIELIDKVRYRLDNRYHSSLSKFYDRQYSKVQEVGWVTGACLMIRRDVFEQIGGFDENFFMYFEDKDLCKRVKELGYKVVYYPKTTIIHLLGGSSHGIKNSINKYYRDSQLYYYQKHLGKFQTNILKLYLKISGKV